MSLFKASVAGQCGAVVGLCDVVVLPMALAFPPPSVGHTFPRLGPHSRRGSWLGRVASRPAWIESMTLLPEVERCAKCGASLSLTSDLLPGFSWSLFFYSPFLCCVPCFDLMD